MIPNRYMIDEMQHELIKTLSVVDEYNQPHHLKLNINTEELSNIKNKSFPIYCEELQASLLKYESEKEKMLVTSIGLSYNNDKKLYNGGGQIFFELNRLTNDNRLRFSTLKSMSTYEKYLFDELKGGDIYGVFGELSLDLKDLPSIRTYTIVYVLDYDKFREVTLYDLEQYGTVLTEITIKKL